MHKEYFEIAEDVKWAKWKTKKNGKENSVNDMKCENIRVVCKYYK